MKLIELDPQYVSANNREKIGIAFDCPCGAGDKLMIPFRNPLDGQPPIREPNWQMSGDSFENLTLTPSIQRNSACRWHGFVTNGEIITV